MVVGEAVSLLRTPSPFGGKEAFFSQVAQVAQSAVNSLLQKPMAVVTAEPFPTMMTEDRYVQCPQVCCGRIQGSGQSYWSFCFLSLVESL
jgi:hypothetical protein